MVTVSTIAQLGVVKLSLKKLTSDTSGSYTHLILDIIHSSESVQENS